MTPTTTIATTTQRTAAFVLTAVLSAASLLFTAAPADATSAGVSGSTIVNMVNADRRAYGQSSFEHGTPPAAPREGGSSANLDFSGFYGESVAEAFSRAYSGGHYRIARHKFDPAWVSNDSTYYPYATASVSCDDGAGQWRVRVTIRSNIQVTQDGPAGAWSGGGANIFPCSDGSTPDPEPEPTKDPQPEPTTDPQPEPTKDPQPEPTKDPQPEPTKDPQPEPEPESDTGSSTSDTSTDDSGSTADEATDDASSGDDTVVAGGVPSTGDGPTDQPGNPDRRPSGPASDEDSGEPETGTASDTDPGDDDTDPALADGDTDDTDGAEATQVAAGSGGLAASDTSPAGRFVLPGWLWGLAAAIAAALAFVTVLLVRRERHDVPQD